MLETIKETLEVEALSPPPDLGGAIPGSKHPSYGLTSIDPPDKITLSTSQSVKVERGSVNTNPAIPSSSHCLLPAQFTSQYEPQRNQPDFLINAKLMHTEEDD